MEEAATGCRRAAQYLAEGIVGAVDFHVGVRGQFEARFELVELPRIAMVHGSAFFCRELVVGGMPWRFTPAEQLLSPQV